jgi:hypothetical protein
MIDSDEVWREVSEGLAAFIAPGESRVLRVDVTMPEHVAVGDRFYLRPLLRAFREDERFFALALDKNGSRLLEADRGGHRRVSLGTTPVSLDEAMKYEDAEPNLAHSGHSPGQAGGSTWGGYGVEKDVATEHTTRFARLLESGVHDAISDRQIPLILLGVERLVSAYREGNEYPWLVKEQVLGATDYLPDAEVVALARKALEPIFDARIQSDLDELAGHEASSLVSHDASEIVAAAATGRVKTLFLDDSSGPFGTFDRESFAVEQVCDRTPRLLREAGGGAEPREGECGWDLVDLAAAETVLHSGRLHAFSGENPPVRGVAALYRY